jgi:hypothetical protein
MSRIKLIVLAAIATAALAVWGCQQPPEPQPVPTIVPTAGPTAT